MSLKLTITIMGYEWDDVDFALDVVHDRIHKEYRDGHSSNETGSYIFEVTGEEERVFSLYDFALEVVEGEELPTFDTFHTFEGFKVEWDRGTYSGERVGNDHFAVVNPQGHIVCEETMANDLDSDALERLAHAIDPTLNSEDIQGVAR